MAVDLVDAVMKVNVVIVIIAVIVGFDATKSPFHVLLLSIFG